MEGVAVPRSGTLLFETFAVSQGLVAFTENGIAVAFATTAFGNDIAFGVVIYEVAQIWAGKVNIAQGFLSSPASSALVLASCEARVFCGWVKSITLTIFTCCSAVADAGSALSAAVSSACAVSAAAAIVRTRSCFTFIISICSLFCV